MSGTKCQIQQQLSSHQIFDSCPFFFPLITGALQSIQVLLQPLLPAPGLLPVRQRAAPRGPLHLLGPFGTCNPTGLCPPQLLINHGQSDEFSVLEYC